MYFLTGVLYDANQVLLKPWADGFIIGSAVVKRLGQGSRAEIQSVLEFVRGLKAAC
jgi:tryptophan synthase alpha subunit